MLIHLVRIVDYNCSKDGSGYIGFMLQRSEKI